MRYNNNNKQPKYEDWKYQTRVYDEIRTNYKETLMHRDKDLYVSETRI